MTGNGDNLVPAATAKLARAFDVAAGEWKPGTRRKYGRCLRRFATFMDAPDATRAVLALVELGPLDGHLQAQEWRQSLVEAGYATAYVAQHVAALKAAWRLVRRVGLAAWDLDLKAPRVTPLRDTRGPSLAELRRVMDAAAAQPGLRGHRDLALVVTLVVLALRRVEASQLDVDDFDREGDRLRIRGKGRDDWEWISVPATLHDALVTYLDARGAQPGEPLFVNHDRRSRGPQRLSPSGIFRVVRRLGERAGLERPLAPHQLRHAAITQALEGTGGDVRRVRAFSRHRKLETVLVYDDRRRDLGGEIAGLVAAAIGVPRTRDASDTPAEPPVDSPEEAPSMRTGTGVSVSNEDEDEGT